MARGRLRALWLLVLKETQTIVTLLTAIAILHLRNAHSVYLGAGATLAAVVAKILKRFIRQPRPELSHKKTYGMPSTHSSSIAFFGVYLSLCISQLPPHPRLPRPFAFARTRSGIRHDATSTTTTLDNRLSQSTRWILIAAVLYCAASVMWSRVRLTYHTPAQVIAGALVGGSLALLCFWVWQTYLAAEWAPLLEATVEDSALLALESWQSSSLEPIRAVVQNLRREWASSRAKSAVDL